MTHNKNEIKPNGDNPFPDITSMIREALSALTVGNVTEGESSTITSNIAVTPTVIIINVVISGSSNCTACGVGNLG
jgi:hypothetical protein